MGVFAPTVQPVQMNLQTVCRGRIPGHLLLRLCRNSPSALTPPLQPSALAYVRWAVVSLPYDMGKSINFTPTLQSAAQSKKEAPETGASLRLL